MTEPGLYPWTIMDPGVIPSFLCCYVDSRHNTVLKCISLSMSWVDLRFSGGLDITLEPDQWHFSKPKSGAQATAVALHQRVAKDATPAGSAMLGLLAELCQLWFDQTTGTCWRHNKTWSQYVTTEARISAYNNSWCLKTATITRSFNPQMFKAEWDVSRRNGISSRIIL